MVRLQIGQEKVKESVEVERQKLQELADEASTVSLMLSARPSYLNVSPSGRDACPCSSAGVSMGLLTTAQDMLLLALLLQSAASK